MWMTLDQEMNTIVKWDEGGFVEGPQLTPLLDENEEPIENEDGSWTWTDQDGNIYTQQEADRIFDDFYGPQYDEAELQEFLEYEISVALADWECGGDFWEIQGEIWEEYQNAWVAENKEALDAWKAAQEG